ncbi:PBECR4 domain-containing protein [Helcococcus bovis]|uniref:PBECR4 domain-containing protein n=1 Tax=Helcococcus bovis TaxID=3153252 RepID=UPI0038BC3A46
MYKIHSIIKWWENFDNSNITIKTKSNEFNIKIFNDMLPHLLGMQYTQKNTKYLKGARLYSFIKNRSDEELLGLISKNHPNKMNNIIDRIENFQYFMENIENSILYNQTHSKSTIKSNFLLIRINNNKYLQLAIATDRQDIDYFETFIINKDNIYFKDSKIKEKIISITRYDPKLKREVPFSFKEKEIKIFDKGEKEMKEYDKEKWHKEQLKKVEEVEKQIDEIEKSYIENPENYIELLEFSKKFSNYSIRNTMLIQKQRENASFVASFVKLKEMGYFVKKGEEAIKIFAPININYVILDDKFKVYSELAKEEKERVKKENIEIETKLGFKLVNVFDVSQTNIPTEDIPKYFDYQNIKKYPVIDKINILEEYLKDNKIELEYKDNLPLGLYGRYFPSLNKIEVSDRLEEIGRLSTLIHEIGHSILHNYNSELQNEKTEIKEIQADSVVILLSNYFDLPILDKTKKHLIDNMKGINKENLSKYIYPVVNKANKLINTIEEKIELNTKQREEIEKEQRQKFIEKQLNTPLPIKKIRNKNGVLIDNKTPLKERQAHIEKKLPTKKEKEVETKELER